MPTLHVREGFTALPNDGLIASSLGPSEATGLRPKDALQTNHRPKWRILVVEEDSPNCENVIALINQQPDLVCCGKGERLAFARASVALHKPDLLLLEPWGPEGARFDLVSSLRAEFPALRLLICSQGDETLHAEKALDSGANGYIMRHEPADELLKSIRTVLSGKVYLSYSLSLKVIQRLLQQQGGESKQIGNGNRIS